VTRRLQCAIVLAALSICLPLTLGFAGSPQPAPKAQPAGGDDIPFPTWDVSMWDTESSASRPRVPATIVPEGVVVLLITILWTACRAVLEGLRGDNPFKRALILMSRRRSFG
jgi:hypothetical protein